MTYLLSIDPGLSTGIVLGEYGDDAAWDLVARWQVAGGVKGLCDWWEDNVWAGIDAFQILNVNMGDGDWILANEDVICEKFTPLAGKGFNHTEKNLEPLRVEGALLALGLNPVWRRPAQQYWVTEENAQGKRRKQKAWIKTNFPDLYMTGATFGQPDAEDGWSALLHSLSYMRSIKHEPTLKHYWPEG